MSSRYTLTQLAENDIEEAVTYIAKENPKSAHDFIDTLYDSFDMLSDNPMLGHIREDLTKHPVRFWIFKWHYLVVYLPEDPLKIIRILSGYRDIISLL